MDVKGLLIFPIFKSSKLIQNKKASLAYSNFDIKKTALKAYICTVR